MVDRFLRLRYVKHSLIFFNLSIYLSIYLSNYLSIYLSIHLSFCWHPSVSEGNGFAPWSSFRGRAATATVAVEPNPRAAGLFAGRAHKGCVVRGIRCCPQSFVLPLHLVLLFQFLFYFDRCRFCGQPPHISVSSQGFKVGRCNIASSEVAIADIFILESWSTSGS